MGTLLLRSDANPQVGAGHVMRALALAHAWQDEGGKVAHRGRCDLPGLSERLASADIGRGPAHADWVAIDGYGFDSAESRVARSAGARVLVLDDTSHREAYDADLLLNQNPHADPAMYADKTGAALLLGPRFALLRKEFWADPVQAGGTRASVEQVLVSLGGSAETAPLAGPIVDAVRRACPRAMVAVIGGAAENLVPVPDPARVRACRDATDVASLMWQADLAISAAGSTCWELARCGVPMIVAAVASNQRPVAGKLGESGVAVDLGWWNEVDAGRLRQEIASLAADASRRATMARLARTMVDGEGGRRVVMRMTGAQIRLRSARLEDRQTLFEWVNEPAVRASAFIRVAIDSEEHLGWFAARLADPRCAIYIALDERDRPVGQVRFDLDSTDSAEIDVSVASDHRGSGVGSELIARGVERLARERGVRRVDARVRLENAASHRAFEKAGFAREGECEVRGQRALLWTRSAA